MHSLVLLCLLSAPIYAAQAQRIDGADQQSWLLVCSMALLLLLGIIIYLWRQSSALRRKTHKFNVLYRNIPEVIREVDALGSIRAFKQEAHADSTLEKQQVDYEHQNEAHKQLFHESLNLAFKRQQPQQYSLKVQAPEGVKYFINRIIPFVNTDGQSHALLITTNISEYKETEHILLQGKIQAQDSAQAKMTFLLNMSHELSSQLQGIESMAFAMQRAGSTDETGQYGMPLLNSVQHMKKITEDVLELAKSDSGQIELDEHEISLWQILDDLEGLFSLQALEKNLHLQVNITSDVPRMVQADAFRLRQVLYNLLSNALTFTQTGYVKVLVSVQSVAGQEVLKFNIQDTGVGIEDDRQESIFDAFKHSPKHAASLQRGVGVGLSICRNLVQIMNGVIGFSSALNKGSQFWFTVPLKKSSNNPALTFWQSQGIYVAIHNVGKRQWFEQFFMSLCIPIKEYAKDSALNKEDLLVSDEQPAAHYQGCFWWLGEDYELALAQGITLTQPYRREALCRRLTQYQQTLNNVADKMLSSGHLLLVEDNLTNQLVIRKTLEKIGYEVSIANNGLEGVQAFEKGCYQGVIMDIQMPVMDGIEAARKIRMLTGPYVPIIALTANVQKEIEEACFAVGMDAFLSKPVNRLALQATLKSVLGQGAHIRQNSV